MEQEASKREPAPGSAKTATRLLVYVRPYVALIALSLQLSSAFSAAQYARAYLMKPVFDDILLPGQNIQGADHDVWQVNVEEDYHEEIRPRRPAASG